MSTSVRPGAAAPSAKLGSVSEVTIQAISALAAAVAALAALASVLQTRRIIKAAALPQMLVEIAHVRPPGTLAVELHNAGGGVARSVWFGAAVDGQLAINGAALFLRPGQSATFGTNIRPMSPSGIAEGVVVWRDPTNRVYASDFAGKRVRLRGRRGESPSLQDAWNRLCPSVPIAALERKHAYRGT